jgi:hypothetical protein
MNSFEVMAPGPHLIPSVNSEVKPGNADDTGWVHRLKTCATIMTNMWWAVRTLQGKQDAAGVIFPANPVS